MSLVISRLVLRTSHLAVLLGVCCLVCSLATSQASAQDRQYTENKADQALKSSARIDPSTLGMSIGVPLGGTPGRAGTGLPINLNYSSKVWRVAFMESYKRPGTSTVTTETRAKYAEHSVAGWTSSTDVPRIEYYTATPQVYDAYGLASDFPADGQSGRFYIARITAHLPDGSSHELRRDDAPHPVNFCAHNPTDPHACFDFIGTFYSTDSSQLRFEDASGMLQMPDGSRYQFGQLQGVQDRYERHATQYIDRHGNTLSYNSTTREWTDTLVLRKVSYLINVLACRTFSIWQEQHNPSNSQATNFVL